MMLGTIYIKMAITFEEAAKRGLVKKVPKPKVETPDEKRKAAIKSRAKKTLKRGYGSTYDEIKEGTIKNAEFYQVNGEIAAGQRTAEIVAESQRQDKITRQQAEIRERMSGNFAQAHQRIYKNKNKDTSKPEGQPVMYMKPNPATAGITFIPTVAYRTEAKPQVSKGGYINRKPTSKSFGVAVEKYTEREAKHNERMGRITKLANKVTFGGGVAYENRSVPGKISQGVVTASLGSIPGIINAVDKAYIVGRGFVAEPKKTWEMVKPSVVLKKEEFTGTFGKTRTIFGKKVFVPFSTPKSATTGIMAGIGAGMYTVNTMARPVSATAKSGTISASQKYTTTRTTFNKGSATAKTVVGKNTHTTTNYNTPTGKLAVVVNRGKGYTQVTIGKNTYMQVSKNTALSSKVSVYKQTMTQPGKAALTTKTTIFNKGSGTVYKSFSPKTKNVVVPKFDLRDSKVMLDVKEKGYVYKKNTGEEVATNRQIIQETYTGRTGFLKSKETTIKQTFKIDREQTANVKATNIKKTSGQYLKLTDSKGTSKTFNNVQKTKAEQVILRQGKLTAPKDSKSGSIRLTTSPDGKINTRVYNYKTTTGARVIKEIDNTNRFSGNRVISTKSRIPGTIKQMLSSKKATSQNLITTPKLNYINVGNGLNPSSNIMSTPSVSIIGNVRTGTIVPFLPITQTKTTSNIITKNDFITRTGHGTQTKQNPNIKFSAITNQKPVTKISPVFKQSIQPVTRTDRVIKTTLKTTTVPSMEIPTTPIFTPSKPPVSIRPTPPPPPPPIGMLWFGGGGGKTKSPFDLKKQNQPKDYTPSAFAASFNIKGKSKKGGIKTGLGLRPII